MKPIRAKSNLIPLAKCMAASVLLLCISLVAAAQQGYAKPPKEVIDAFDAPPLPTAILSPSKQVIALTYRRGYPSIAELSRPMLRLAGLRVNPKTNGPHRTAGIYAISVKQISDGNEVKV